MKVLTLQRAKSDLLTAKNHLNQEEDELYKDVVAYHLQQCVEKCIKSCLESKGIVYPKTHNITILQELLGDDIVNETLGPYSTVFTSWESSTRYAGESIPSSLNMKPFIEIAEKLYNYCSTFSVQTSEFGKE